MRVAVARMKKYVPLVLPWFLPSAMFSVVVAAVHSWKTDSLQFALLFVGTSSFLALITHFKLNFFFCNARSVVLALVKLNQSGRLTYT